MELRYACPQCGAEHLVPDAESSTVISCSRCGFIGLLPADWALDGRVDRCPICGTKDLFRRRDLHQKLLIILVIAGVTLALFTRYLSLLAAAILGVLVYIASPEALICYRCGSSVRGHRPTQDHDRYDPETAERAGRDAGRPTGRSDVPWEQQ